MRSRFIVNYLEVAFVLFALPSIRGETPLTIALPLLALVNPAKNSKHLQCLEVLNALVL
jgi:hypothetical protein